MGFFSFTRAICHYCSKACATFLIYAIQFIRPILRPTDCCRFSPSCSRFAIQQLQTQPLFKAIWASTRRLLSCVPCSPRC